MKYFFNYKNFWKQIKKLQKEQLLFLHCWLTISHNFFSISKSKRNHENTISSGKLWLKFFLNFTTNNRDQTLRIFYFKNTVLKSASIFFEKFWKLCSEFVTVNIISYYQHNYRKKINSSPICKGEVRRRLNIIFRKLMSPLHEKFIILFHEIKHFFFVL